MAKKELFRLLTVTTLMIVAGKARFTVQPVRVEKAEGLEAVFRCQHQMEELTVTYDWAINDLLVTTDTETVRARPPSSSGEPTTLTIVAIPQYNNSVVQCQANIRNGIDLAGSKRSTTATLIVHVTAITNVLTAPNTIIVMWNALPLTEYCVDINKTTLNSTEKIVLDSVCGLVNEHIFTYPNHSVCVRFSLTVTPTEREMRGTTSEPDTGFCVNLNKKLDTPTSAPTTFPTSDPRTDSLPESQPTSIIAGISLVVVVIMIVLIIVCLKKGKRGGKGLHSSYNNDRVKSNSEGGFILIRARGALLEASTSREGGVARPDSPEWNTADTMSYKFVAAASDSLPSPMIQRDGEAPNLPPPTTLPP